MALLPDGRALILTRGVRIGWPFYFPLTLVVAEPRTIRPGAEWNWTELARIEGPAPNENYEGMAVTGGDDGDPIAIWLISDSNGAQLIQRTLLLRLEWDQ